MSDKMYHNMRCERRIRKNKARRQREMQKNIILIIMTFCLIITASLSMNSFFSNASDSNTSYKYYKSITIENGDTLWSIAQEYMDDKYYDSINEYINEIKRMNTLNNDDITYGQHLIVPYYEETLK